MMLRQAEPVMAHPVAGSAAKGWGGSKRTDRRQDKSREVRPSIRGGEEWKYNDLARGAQRSGEVRFAPSIGFYCEKRTSPPRPRP
jgi:hypothetical protein